MEEFKQPTTKKSRKSKGPKKFKVTPLWEQKKQIVHEDLIVRSGRIYYIQWLFRPDEYQCGSCNDTTNVVFSRQSPLNVVIKSCTHCGVTQQVDPEDNRGAAIAIQLIEPRPISDAKVKDFVKRNRYRKEFLKAEILKIYEKKPKKIVDLENIDLELDDE